MCDIQNAVCNVDGINHNCSAVFYSIEAAFGPTSSARISLTWNEKEKLGLEPKNLVVFPTDVNLTFSIKKNRVISSDIHFDPKKSTWLNKGAKVSGNPCKFLQANPGFTNMRLTVKLVRGIKSLRIKYPSKNAQELSVTIRPLLTEYHVRGREVSIISNFQEGWKYDATNETIYKDIPLSFAPRKAGAGGKKKKSPRRRLSPRRSPKKEEGEITCESRLVDIKRSDAFKELQLKGKWKLNKAEVCEALGL